jgi:hypothetical protein
MELALDPPRGVGPLRLGLTVDEARSALGTLGPLTSPTSGGLAVNLPSGLGFSVGFNVGPTGNRVNAIEIWRPHAHDVLRYRDVNVFGLPALEVVERMRKHVDVVPNENGAGFTARELYLAFWRPFAADDNSDEEEGFYFQSVLLARPGYDDTPAEAAARLAAGGEPGY